MGSVEIGSLDLVKLSIFNSGFSTLTTANLKAAFTRIESLHLWLTIVVADLALVHMEINVGKLIANYVIVFSIAAVLQGSHSFSLFLGI